MFSEKRSVQILASVLAEKGICDVVFSPGSRNAPFVIQMAENPSFETQSIPDERCAAFYAMGMAQWKRKPVVICCTSGSAALNYAPAIAEAYYQGIPLIVLTADRPNEWIDHGEGQSIRQRSVFQNFIKGSFELPQHETGNSEWYTNRIANESINLSMHEKAGPVHINVPFDEPLYGTTTETVENPRIISQLSPEYSLSEADIDALSSTWSNTGKKLIICGLNHPNHALQNVLNKLSHDASVAILSETTSNVFGQKIYSNIDRILAGIEEESIGTYIPELLVTVGGPIVSKKIKALLRHHSISEHWHIDPSYHHQDVFKQLTKSIIAQPADVLNKFEINTTVQDNAYGNRWQKKHWETKLAHEKAMEHLAFSDLSIYRDVLDFIPDDSVIHMANSTAVRYTQLFDPLTSAAYFCNRGTSGIDGSTSTAIGSANVNNRKTILLSGDTSFIYDSNAFWNTKAKHFKSIVVNNNGGGIFRIIDGPETTGKVDDYFEVQHGCSVKSIAEMYGIPYYSASNQQELDTVLPTFFNFDSETNGILEIFSDSTINPIELKQYFRHLKS